jgi:hypothetical protein
MGGEWEVRFNTSDTVAGETLAFFATSFIVTTPLNPFTKSFYAN